MKRRHSEYARPSGRAKEKHCLEEASNLSQTDHQNSFLKGGVKQDNTDRYYLQTFTALSFSVLLLSGCSDFASNVSNPYSIALQRASEKHLPPGATLSQEAETPQAGPMKLRAIHRAAPAPKEQYAIILLTEFRDASAARRTTAASRLGELGPAALLAFNELANAAIHDESKWVRRAAVKALPKIDPRRSQSTLQKALSDKDRWVRHSAQNALRRVQK